MSTLPIFTSAISTWYHLNKRKLPWREDKIPYKIWVSEIILQQTKVAQGEQFYRKFLHKFRTVQHLAKANEEEVLKIWQGLGYYSRARNMHKTAKYLANECNGEFPNSYQELLKLKGIGPYTAAAIASICFDEATAVVDGNVYRVLARYFGVKEDIGSTVGQKQFKELAQSLIPSSEPGNYNQAIMEFGALQCVPQSPNCAVCPLQESCWAFANKQVSALPVKAKKTKVQKRFYNYAFIKHKHKILLHKRDESSIWAGLYEPYLIESKDESLSKNQVHDQLMEDFNMDKNSLNIKENSFSQTHKLSHRNIQAKFWEVETNNYFQVPNKEYLWVDEKHLEKYPVSRLTELFLNHNQKS